jgi:hypothetical protein
LARKEEALGRLAREFLVFAGVMLINDDYESAFSYLSYARILDRGIVHDEAWQRLTAMHAEKKPDRNYIASQNTMFEARKRSYAPPEGFEPLDMETVC